MISGKKKCFFCEYEVLSPLIVRGQEYDRCLGCGGIFLRPEHYLTNEAERDRYTMHHNGLENADYRTYLERFLDSTIACVSLNFPDNPPIKNVLDWGSGPTPSLVALLRERDYDARGYDPFFLADFEPFAGGADLMMCLEVAEHFHDPSRSFAEMARHVRPGGFLAVKTGFLPDVVEIDSYFASWWYREDPTHVCFYTERSLNAVALRAGLEVLGFAGKDIALLRKP